MSRKKSANKLKLLPVLGLAVVMTFAQPREAHAQMVVIDPAALIKFVLQELQTAGAAIGHLISQMAQLEGQKTIAQAQNDNTTNAARSTWEADITKDHVVVSGNKSCTSTAITEASAHMNDLEDNLGIALGQSAADTKPDHSGGTKAAMIKDLCAYGFLPTQSTGASNGDFATWVKSLGGSCATSPKYPALIYANQNPNVVTRPLQYTVPANISVGANNALIMPSMSNINTDPKDQSTGNTIPSELEYVAAYSYCLWSKGSAPLQPHSTGSQKPNLADVGTVDTNLNAGPAINACFTRCMDEVNHHAAVSATTGGKSPTLKDMHDTQARQCELMRAEGYISKTELDDCEKNGMSGEMADSIIAHRGTRPEYLSYLASSGLTHAEVVLAQQTMQHDAQAFDRARRDEAAELQAFMSKCKADMPPTAEPNPNAQTPSP